MSSLPHFISLFVIFFAKPWWLQSSTFLHDIVWTSERMHPKFYWKHLVEVSDATEMANCVAVIAAFSFRNCLPGPWKGLTFVNVHGLY